MADKKSVLRAIFELGSFTAAELQKRSGEDSVRFVQSIIADYTRQGFLARVSNIRTSHGVWALLPEMQEKLINEIGTEEGEG